MSWDYTITANKLKSPDGRLYEGYSGTGSGRDNPKMCAIRNVGPIPPGDYLIGPSFTDPTEGLLVMSLTPSEGTETYGRTGFRIHGDSADHDASHGCLILMRPVRQSISDSQDRILRVHP